MSQQNEVIQAVETMTAAFHAKDIEGVMRAYEDHATVAFQPGSITSDPEGIRAGFCSFFALDPKFEYAGHDVIVQGDVAIHFAPWKMRGNAPDGSPVEMEGFSIAVLRRDDSGTWRLVIDNPFGQTLWEATRRK